MAGEPAYKTPRLSVSDFDEMLLDKPEDEKWELIGGQLIKGMSGAVVQHHVIIDNVSIALSNHLRRTARPCRVFRESFYLRRIEDNLNALPDIMVRCGPIVPGMTSVSDPVVLMEVVSPGSEAKDRAIKRVAYQNIPSLQHYVLIARDQALVDVYNRADNGWHGAPPLLVLTSVLRLPAIDFEMSLADVYQDVMS